MSKKEQHGNKEQKKAAAHTAKEKRQIKHAKKHASETLPLIPPHH